MSTLVLIQACAASQNEAVYKEEALVIVMKKKDSERTSMAVKSQNPSGFFFSFEICKQLEEYIL